MLYSQITKVNEKEWTIEDAYGNNRFTFDAIYPNRVSMDQHVVGNGSILFPSPHDIKAGRFVVIFYGDYEARYKASEREKFKVGTNFDFPVVYNDQGDQEDEGATSSTLDGSLFFGADCLPAQRIQLVTYQRVTNPRLEDLGTYYTHYNGFYTKAVYFSVNEAYYTAVINNENYAGTLSVTNGVSVGQVVRRRYSSFESGVSRDIYNDDGQLIRTDIVSNPNPNAYTDDFYVCTGACDGNPRYAKFVPVTEGLANVSSDLRPYFNNFNIDKAHYSTLDSTWATLHKGYDATVWQKIVGEGYNSFVLVCHLNAIPQGITVIPEPPTIIPIDPFLDSDSTDLLARIHMQTPWSFRVKPIKEMTEETKSDGTVSITEYTWGITEENASKPQRVILNKTETEYPADIFFNKDGFDKYVHHKDLVKPKEMGFGQDPETEEFFASVREDGSDNEILVGIGKTERFDEKYKHSYLKEADSAIGDTQELSIHLPSIGNMVSLGYDLLYGNPEKDDETKNPECLRHLDINWYPPSKGKFRTKGDTDTYVVEKTYDLDSFAGCLNTFHNRLGQIIEPISLIPTKEVISATWDKETLYEDQRNGAVYRKGMTYELSDVNYELYECSDEVNEFNYSPYMYYIENTDNITDTNRLFTARLHGTNRTITVVGDVGPYREDRIYYKKVPLLSTAFFNEIHLEEYIPNTFYRKDGVNYKILTGINPPADENSYLSVLLSQPKTFAYNYKPNTFYYIDTNRNYILAAEETPLSNRRYYDVATNSRSATQWVYKPNIYYYEDQTTGQLLRETADMPSEVREYKYLELEQSLTKIIVDGIEYYGQVVKNSVSVDFSTWRENADKDFYFIGADNNYYRVTEAFLKERDADFFSNSNIRMYIIDEENTVDITDQLYVPDNYYIIDEDNNIILASEEKYNKNSAYYLIEGLVAHDPFYRQNVYYYKTNKADGETDEEYELRSPILDGSATISSQEEGKYYTKSGLYVIEDKTSECPYGFEWNIEADFVPWPISLAKRKGTIGAIEIPGINNGKDSLNGILLQLANSLELGDNITRDRNTLQGAMNLVTDKFYSLGNLVPKHLVFTNEFGRLTSSVTTDEQLQELTLSTIPKLRTDLNAEITNRTNAILALDYDDTSNVNESNIVSQVSEVDGKISVNHKYLTAIKLAELGTLPTTYETISASDTLGTALKKLQKGLNILNGGSTDIGSVAYQIAQIVNENNNGTIDTLDEIAAWIVSDTSGAAKLNSDIVALKNKTLLGSYDDEGILKEYDTVKDYVEAEIASIHVFNNQTLLDSLTQSDLNKWNSAEQNAKNYADGLASNYDANGSAAAAEQSAKDYADNLFDSCDPIGTAETKSLEALEDANDYTDTKVSELSTSIENITGTTEDTKEDLTLNGLLAYIQELEARLDALTSSSTEEPVSPGEGE